MPTPRQPTAPTTAAIDQFCAHCAALFARFEERTALRQYLIGLLLAREHTKTLVELAASVPGARRPPPAARHCTTSCTTRPGTPRHSPAVGWRCGRRIPCWARLRAAGSSSLRRAIPNAATASCWPPSSTWASWAMSPTGWWQ
jgi:hypothetical protein